MRNKPSLNNCQVIVALSLVGVIWLAVLFSVMTYNFELVNKDLVTNEELVKNTTIDNLKNTFKNRDHISNILNNMTEINTKLDKLLNQTSNSNK